MGTRPIIYCFVLLIGGLGPATVFAVPSAAAQARSKETYKAGVALFKAQKYREAILEFNKAYRDSPSPTLMYNIARAFEELGEYRLAIDSYQEYLKAAPEASDRERVARTLTTLGRLESSMSTDAELKIESVPTGAQVMLDGELVGQTPQTLTVKPGTHAVRLSREGFEPVTVNHKVVARRASSLQIGLRATEVVRVTERTPSWVSWALVGSGGVALIAGGAALLLGQYAADEAEGLSATRSDIDRYHDLREEHATAFGVGVTGVSLGAAMLTGGLALLVVEAPSSTEVGLTPGGVVWGGRF